MGRSQKTGATRNIRHEAQVGARFPVARIADLCPEDQCEANANRVDTVRVGVREKCPRAERRQVEAIPQHTAPRCHSTQHATQLLRAHQSAGDCNSNLVACKRHASSKRNIRLRRHTSGEHAVRHRLEQNRTCPYRAFEEQRASFSQLMVVTRPSSYQPIILDDVRLREILI